MNAILGQLSPAQLSTAVVKGTDMAISRAEPGRVAWFATCSKGMRSVAGWGEAFHAPVQNETAEG